ncbi:MAG: domain S-box, partial [Lacunisphaera sp.]|nr:domain S-box [Lacunisphaera sp.]
MKNSSARKPSAAPPRRRPPAAGNEPLISAEDLAQLREELRETQETLEAIRTGEVDAVIVNGTNGDQVYSLAGAEQPYRIYLERMQEGAVTVSADGVIFYANRRFAEMLGRSPEKVTGTPLKECLTPQAWKRLEEVFT